MNLMHTELAHFLCVAKRATYAAQDNAAQAAAQLPDTKQLEYLEGSWFYRDIYAGQLHFAGQEVVHLDQGQGARAVWSMVYSGGLTEGVPANAAGAVYTALRAALRALPESLPLRGPAQFLHEDLLYRCEVEGTLLRFHGQESILRDGHCVYALHFSGGVLL